MSTATPPTPAPQKSQPAKAKAQAEPSPEPIIIDMGKRSRKQVRKLSKGKPGRLMDRVQDALAHLQENGALTGDVQPIVIIVKQRQRRRGGRIAKMWGLG